MTEVSEVGEGEAVEVGEGVERSEVPARPPASRGLGLEVERAAPMDWCVRTDFFDYSQPDQFTPGSLGLDFLWGSWEKSSQFSSTRS